MLVELNNSGLNKLQFIKGNYNRYSLPDKLMFYLDLPILLTVHKSYVVKIRKKY